MQSTLEVQQFHNMQIDEYLQEVDRHLRPFMVKATKKVPKVYPLHDGVAFQINTGGKRLRAALCVTSCAMFCGSMMRAMNFAATIEHLQNFMLAHDDIADGDEERRARESIWKKFGIGHGLNIGDVFITLGAHSILDSPYATSVKLRLIKFLCEMGLEISEGQSLDINLKTNNRPITEDYIECTKKKTGSFFAMAIVGGAIIGGADEKYFQGLYDFATHAGVAFQVKDDLIDITGGKGRTQGSDIKEGKRTLLTIYAGEKSSIRDREKLISTLNRSRAKTTDEEIKWVFNLFNETRSIKFAETIANKSIEQAIKYLNVIPASESKSMLLKISNFICLRTH